MGLLINRDQPLDFSFDGQHYQGLQGDSIASALLSNGRFLISRSFKYHRPRGPLTMAGQDANSLVQLPQEPNVLADAHALSAGLQVTAQNVNGSLDNDRDAYLGKFSRFMPVGFYYRSFYKPKGMWKVWEPIIRKKAGLGVLDLKFQPEYYDKAYLFTDVAVIGAGPAGLHAALTAANAGGPGCCSSNNSRFSAGRSPTPASISTATRLKTCAANCSRRSSNTPISRS
nr:hypothetical protein GCM10020185_85950 [Pseudomonas brassicacearum subsp. brassicacearum]